MSDRHDHDHEQPLAAARPWLNRWLGLGLAACLSVITIGLAVRGQMQLYINPAQTWFAVGMSVIVLIAVVWSFLLPVGAEAGHDHGDGTTHSHEPTTTTWRRLGAAATIVGGSAATVVAVSALVLPPASLSVQLAMDRDTGVPPLFAAEDVVALAASGDTANFGVGEWATTFITTTRPESFSGTPVTLTGYVTPDETNPEAIRLGRLVITHCVIDAQPASVPVALTSGSGEYAVGQWIEVDGTIGVSASGALEVNPTTINVIAEPADPYEY